MIEAVIFDMDGVLIESEPLWREAEIEVFKKVGINLTEEMCLQTTGLRTDETVAHWYRFQPWNNLSRHEVGLEIEEEVCKIVDRKGVTSPGVSNIMKFFNSRGIPKALATSSAPGVIERILGKLGLKEEFKVIYSAVNEEYGKPHPAVYITTAAKMNVIPVNCLAIEDSFAGLLAAKSAKMRTIVIPEEANRESARFSIADLKLESLLDFSEEHWDMLNSLNGIGQ